MSRNAEIKNVSTSKIITIKYMINFISKSRICYLGFTNVRLRINVFLQYVTRFSTSILS